ncbi:MAG: hypothetical protein M1839_001360 [Geoglossum umbratile]|nr:MAG: hypothetical protein M1839_001360 [Geoglossum umbratile]
MSRTAPTRLEICLRCQLRLNRSASSVQPTVTPLLRSKRLISSSSLAHTTKEAPSEQIVDGGPEKWKPPKEKRWLPPNKPIGKLRGRKGHQIRESVANLQIQALGEPAKVIILRDSMPDNSRSVEHLNSTEREIPDTENLTLMKLLAKLDAERGLISQEDVNTNVEVLRPSPNTVLSQEDFSKLADELCKGFTTTQLAGYTHAFEAKQPPKYPAKKMERPTNIEETEWTPRVVPKPSSSVEMGVTSAAVRNVTKKRKLAERVLRRCWSVQTEEEYESIGQIELCLRHRELSLLLRERNSLMQRFSETYNCQVGVSQSRRTVQVTGRRYGAQNLVLALKKIVKSIACAEFDMAPFLPLRESVAGVDIIEKSTIEAISQSTDTEIERGLDRNKVNIYYWSWKTANLEKARRLLHSRLELPNYSKSAVFADTDSARGSLALCRTGSGTELPLNERNIQWSRCRFGLTKGGEALQNKNSADEKPPIEMSKNPAIKSNIPTVKQVWALLQPTELENTAHGSFGNEDTKGENALDRPILARASVSSVGVQNSGKAENHPAGWSARPVSSVSVRLGQVLHKATGLPPVHPIQLRGLLAKDAKSRSFLTGFSGLPNLLRTMKPLETVSRQYLSMRLVPSPWISSGLKSTAKFPHIEISVRISEDTGEPQSSVAQAIVEENIADLMLPSTHADLRFSRRTKFTLFRPLLDEKIKEFVKSGELRADGKQLPGAPPHIELRIPKRLIHGISTPELDLVDDGEKQIHYNLVGLDVQQRIQFDYRGWKVTYSDIDSGKVRGRRAELLLTMDRNTIGADSSSSRELPSDFPTFFDDARRLVGEIENLSPNRFPTDLANNGLTKSVPNGVLLGADRDIQIEPVQPVGSGSG